MWPRKEKKPVLRYPQTVAETRAKFMYEHNRGSVALSQLRVPGYTSEFDGREMATEAHGLYHWEYGVEKLMPVEVKFGVEANSPFEPPAIGRGVLTTMTDHNAGKWFMMQVHLYDQRAREQVLQAFRAGAMSGNQYVHLTFEYETVEDPAEQVRLLEERGYDKGFRITKAWADEQYTLKAPGWSHSWQSFDLMPRRR